MAPLVWVRRLVHTAVGLVCGRSFVPRQLGTAEVVDGRSCRPHVVEQVGLAVGLDSTPDRWDLTAAACECGISSQAVNGVESSRVEQCA